jgi:hypothetical protein
MRQVCYNKKNANYASYGAKGIKIGSEFEEFWDFVDIIETRLGPPPNGYLSKLARKDQAGDYTIKNLKWDVAKNVGRRCPRTFRVKYKGKNLPVREWSEITGINFHTILGRIDRGWSPAEALGYKIRK